MLRAEKFQGENKFKSQKINSNMLCAEKYKRKNKSEIKNQIPTCFVKKNTKEKASLKSKIKS